MAGRWTAGAALLLIVAGLGGCLGAAPADPDDGARDTRNIWESGLAAYYETPPHVRTATASERRADLATPGDPGFVQFDESMQNFMDQYEIPAGQLSVLHNDQLIYTAGYGYSDRDGTGTVDERNMFRFASVIKPITHALLTLQVEEGLYNWTDPVFCIPPEPASNCRLPIDPHPDRPIIDERLGDVTVQHLVDHTGGWGGSMTYLNHPSGIAEMRPVLGIEGAPRMWQVAQYVMGAELQSAPGTQRSYCNVCYSLAGLVAEAATGVNINALIDAYLLRPLEISGDLQQTRNLPEDRDPREPFYHADTMVPSVYDPNETVREPDGGANFDTIFTAGGFTGTTEAIATIYGAYPELIPASGDSLVGVGGADPWASYERRSHTGAVIGTSALSVWAEDKNSGTGRIQYVAVFNDAAGAFCTGADAGVVDYNFCRLAALSADLMTLGVLKAQERSAR